MEDKRTAAQLKPGETGIIQSVETPENISLRFMELGIGPGESIKYIRTSPFGDPIEIEVMNTRLAIRLEEANKIILERV